MTSPASASPLPAGAIAITALGMTASGGLDVASACASARAGATHWSQLDIEEPDLDTLESIPLKGHAVRGLTDGFEGVGRLLRLGDAALTDLMTSAKLQPTHHARTGFFLCLPGHFHSTWLLQLELLGQGPAPMDVARAEFARHFEEQRQWRDKLETSLVPSLLSMQSLAIAPALRACFHGGPAVFAQAVEQAIQRLRSRELDRCIVGGIDTCVHGDALTTLHTLGLLRTEEQPSGFFPGEAAAFVLLERADALRARSAPVEATVAAVATRLATHDRAADKPEHGVALSAAVEACLRDPRRKPNLVVVNLNGDEYRAREFGMALVRMREAGLPAELRYWYPPEPFGELGAATGAVSACLAVRAFTRGYAESDQALILLLGDDAARGALVLDDIPTQSRSTR